MDTFEAVANDYDTYDSLNFTDTEDLNKEYPLFISDLTYWFLISAFVGHFYVS